jgi:bacterioferritin
MATRQDLIDRLNTVLSWELAGVVQYLHYAVLVSGPLRPVYTEFFHDGSKEARDHAEAVGAKIASLGGVPTAEPAAILPATDLETMLQNTLKLEVAALAAWEAAWEVGDAVNLGTKLWIEEHVSEEQEHVDELNRILASPFSLAMGSAGATRSA